MTRRIVVVSAGLGVPSTTRLLADRLSGAVASRVAARGESARSEVVELRELAVPLATWMVTGGVPTPQVEAARTAVADADGVIAVTPVFAASYAGLFKLFVDTLDPEALTGTPVLVAATAGTARHSLVLDHALRPLFAHLRAVVVPTGVFAATDDFGGSTGDADPSRDEPLTARIERAAAELADLVVGAGRGVTGFLPAGVESAGAPRPGAGWPPSPGEPEVTPFETLLRGHTGAASPGRSAR